MPITRSQIRRQLRRQGGIMDVTPGTIGGGNYTGIPMGSRTGFGILDKVKDTVRKIIPNEIADIAVKAAPFVAPFNPAAAAAMAGIGGFDQTGSIGGSLKSAALTYGGGQLARYAGGAGFQGNPFTEGGAFRGGLEGFKGGFSFPIGTKTGFKLGKTSQPVTGVQEVATPDSAKLGKQIADQSIVNRSNILAGQPVPGADPGVFVEQAAFPEKFIPVGMGDTGVIDTTITDAVVKDFSPKTFLQDIFSGDPAKIGNALKEGAAKAGDAIFYKEGPGGKRVLDKTALLAAGSFGLTYLDAKKIADEAGVDLTVEEYDEAAKEEKQKEYEGYLKNFFGGRKEGGRIGFKFGEKVEDSEGIMSMQKDEEDEDMKMAGITFSKAERAYLFKKLGSSGTSGKSKSMPNLYYILNDPGSYPADAKVLKEIAIMGMGKKEGGRIGFENGANKEIAIKNAMAELKTKFPELSDENLFNLVMNGFGGTSKEKELPTPNITLEEAEKRNPAMFVDTTTSNPIPENAPNMAAAEIAKVILGTSGDDQDMTSRKFIFEEYVMPKRNDLMENFGLDLKEADDLIREEMNKYKKPKMAMGGEIPVRENQGGVMELDYRENGGFVPVGIKEKADDVPAMLSKNEFVLTADAVRGVGNGSVDKGAEKLYNFMKQAEKVGQA